MCAIFSIVPLGCSRHITFYEQITLPPQGSCHKSARNDTELPSATHRNNIFLRPPPPPSRLPSEDLVLCFVWDWVYKGYGA